MRERWRKHSSMFLWVVLLFMQTATVKADALAYQEQASEIILNSLMTQPKKSFLTRAYKALLFTPVWMKERQLSTAAKEFFEVIESDGTLDPEGKMYQDARRLRERAESVYRSGGTVLDKVNLEFKISQLYKGYTDYAYFGSINWGAFQARISNLIVNDVSTEWVLHRPEVYPIKMLEKAALGSSLKKELQDAVPNVYHYRALQKALERYIHIREAGGWEHVLLFSKLNPGMHSAAVPALRERLRVTGDYRSCDESLMEDRYDACLQKAVKHFQKRHGLKVDGVVGPGTLRELNKTVDERITTIRLNLDRIKWLSDRGVERHIIINIPAFELYFEEHGKLIQSMRVVVGTPNHPTPIFSDTVEYIVLNPYWNIPTSIIQKEMIPKLLRNPHAMKKQDIEIRAGWGKDAPVVDPASVNWAQYRYSKTVPFRFAQLPGNKNALGKIKFLFPNRFSVYMHDTPSKHLFKRDKRAFSHGCIRLQQPRELLRTFSSFNDTVDFEKSQEILKSKEKQFLNLKKKVPIDVVYLTAWIDYDGELQFRNDIYHYDEMQLKSFRRW